MIISDLFQFVAYIYIYIYIYIRFEIYKSSQRFNMNVISLSKIDTLRDI